VVLLDTAALREQEHVNTTVLILGSTQSASQQVNKQSHKHTFRVLSKSHKCRTPLIKYNTAVY